MKTLKDQIEELRAHVRDLTSTERQLVRALGEELRRADEELLLAIRSVASEHEKRRTLIVVELQALAERAGLLQQPKIERDPGRAAIQHHHRPAVSLNDVGGSLEEEVAYHLKRRAH